jgi:hypothetical protein
MAFYNDYLNNNIEFETVHDEIARWHSGKDKTSLHEFLGLSFAEYKILVENESKFESYLKYLKETNGR